MASSEVVGVLRILLSADAAEYEAVLKKSGDDAVKFGNKFEGIGKQISAVGKTIAASLAAAFTVSAISGAISRVVEYTGKLTDLAGKSGMTAEALQRLNFVTAQSGVSLEKVAQGAVILGRNLAGGNASAVRAVEALNLSLDELIAMGPDRAFLAIGEAIAKVPNPMEQAALATALFGRAGADYLPSFTANMTEVADAAQRSGSILSNEMVAAGDQAGDALGRLQMVGAALLAKVLIPMLPAIEMVANWLGTALPAALNASQAGIDFLIRKGMEMRTWLLDMAVSIAQTVADVPVLGRVFGESAGDISRMRVEAQFARDALNSFNAQGARPTVETVQKGAPLVTNFSKALDHVNQSAGRAAKTLKTEQVPALEQSNLLMGRSLQETGKLTQQLQAWAHTNGALLAPSIEQVNAALEEQEPLIARTIDAWATLKPAVQQTGVTLAAEVPKWAQVFQSFASSLPQVIVSAIQGGGSVLSAAGAHIGTTLMDGFSKRFGPAITAALPFGIGAAVTALLPTLGALFGPVAEKIGGFFKKIFGGASAEEKAGRASVEAFEQSLWDTLTAAQELEAGGEDWKKTVIALRDAYIAAGKSEEDALRAAEALWASSREGAEESARVIKEIERILGRLPDQKTIDIDVNYNTQGEPTGVDPGFASGTMGRLGSWFGRFPASGMATKLHNVEAVLRPQDAMPFAADVMRSAGEGGASSQNNNVALLVMQPGEALDPAHLAREVFKQFRGGLQMDTEGMTRSIEMVVANYLRTYQHG